MGYCHVMKRNTTEANIQNERSITSTNSVRNTRTTVAPGPGHCLQKRKKLLWIALPFTLAVGAVFGPRSSAVADEFFTDFPAPVEAPISQRQAANEVVAHEIYNMFMANRSSDCSLTAVNDQGVVTLGGKSFVWFERQNVINQTWKLAGVNQVQDQQGVGLKPTPASKAVAVQ